MEKRGLIIGIDYTGKYCQASYYSRRHRCPESISYGGESVRYLIPTALCYNHETSDWLIGQPAIDYAEKTGEGLYRNFLENVFLGNLCYINGQEYTYTQLLAVFTGKIIELMQIATSIMGVQNITINLRRVTLEIKKTFEDVFRLLRLPVEKLKLQNCAESFAYYVLDEDPEIWEKGTILFDFSPDGFYEKILTVTRGTKERLVYISERNHVGDYSMRDMGNEVLMDQMDERLKTLYEEIISESSISSVYFTGEGFQNIWFPKALRRVSEENRAFKGNNLYAKGACLAGLMRSEENKDYNIICSGRTKFTISVETKHKGEPLLLNLCRAPRDWFDSGMKMDFILDRPEFVRFYLTSILSGKRSIFDIDVSEIPLRPTKATRIEIEIRYFSENECEITIRDKGFGELFPSSGFEVTKQIDFSDEL
ncbi:MAG: hypothetical protein IKF90_24410 [Parasporobacterium sp.]|nr:hypothetical protein [Parasporobacterium sp.]